jgi:hypothetical protein
MQKYSKEIEDLMLLYYKDLPEQKKRHYASIEAAKLGHGGKSYICELLSISQKTIRKADRELDDPTLLIQIPLGKQRRQGGGRKKFCSVYG